MAELSLELLGAPRVTVEGRLLSVDTKKAIALLAYMAATQRAFSRDSLASLLWPEYDQQRARASLRRTLSALRKGLGPLADALAIEKDLVQLRRPNGHGVDVDVVRFNSLVASLESHGHASDDVCAACLQPLTEAVALYRGSFLAGFSVRDCPEFDEWQRYQSELLEHALARALERLATIASSSGRHADAIAAAHRRISLDPVHEPAHRQLMLAYAWGGDRGAALQQYRRCARMLDDELGVAPLPETTELAELIRNNGALPPPVLRTRSERDSSTFAASQSVLDDKANAPLVGRAREWQSLLEAYAAAKYHGCLVILEGEPGIGKTRLAEEFIAQIRAREAIVMIGHCYEGESDLAYGPFGEAIRSALEDPLAADRLRRVPGNWLAEAARLVPELTQQRPDFPSPVADERGAAARLIEGLRQVIVQLLHRNARGPGILLLDDLQWADDASLELLQHITRHFRDCSLLIIVTWRDDGGSASGRLHRLLADARRSGTVTRLTLERLQLEQITELACFRLGAPEVSRDLATRLYEQTEGLPLFLVMCLEAIADHSTELEAMPAGIRDLIRARLEYLSETARQLLGAASVLGHRFDFETLREASGRTEDETATALEELLARRMVREADADYAGVHFDFTHEQLRKAMYDDMSLVRRRLLHRRVAEVFRARFDASPTWLEPGEVAMHYRLGGQDHLAAEYYVLGGEWAQRLHANAEALAHFEAALALGYSDTVRLHEAIGDLRTLSGAYALGSASYELAASQASPERLVILERKLGSLCVRQGAWERAESHFEAALSLEGQGESAERAHLLAAWSLAAYRQDQLDRAWKLGSDALRTAELADAPRAVAECHNIIGMLARHRGDLPAAEYHLRRSLQMATDDDLSARVAALNNMALLNAAKGQAQPGLALLDDALEVCNLLGDHHQQAALLANSADLLRATGDLSGAVVRMKEAAAILAEIGAELGSLEPEIWKLSEW